MNGVTGRMGYQPAPDPLDPRHPRAGRRARSPTALTLWPEPVLVGRSERRLRALAERARPRALDRPTSTRRWPTRTYEVYFDAAGHRRARRRRASGRSPPASTSTPRSRSPPNLRAALRAGAAGRTRPASSTASCRTSSSCPGCCKLQRLVDGGFFGRILSVRGEFGYWVFEGDWQPRPAARPGTTAPRTAAASSSTCSATGATCSTTCSARCARSPRWARRTSPSAWTRAGEPYAATADDAAYATFELEGGIVAQLNSSWCVRVYRDELVEFQVDGTHGSAVAGLRALPRAAPRRHAASRSGTRTSPTPNDFRAAWLEVPDNDRLRQRLQGPVGAVPAPRGRRRAVPLGPAEGAKGVQLAELAERSWRERRRLEVPELEA